jgi:hypothetical protein
VLEIANGMVEVALVCLLFIGDSLLELADGRVGGHAFVVRGETKWHLKKKRVKFKVEWFVGVALFIAGSGGVSLD